MNALRSSVPVFFCAVLVGCSLSRTDVETSVPRELSVLEREVHRLINEYRISRRLAPLSADETIAHHARIHSQNMADGQVVFGHDGFGKRVEMISGQLSYTAAAENVAYNNQAYSDCAEFAVDGWIESPGHLVNIEGDYRLTGVGVAVDSAGVYYFTQIFWR